MTSTNKHLVILCHGLWGKPSHMFALRDALKKRDTRNELEIVCCRTYAGTRTYDGVDVCADRVIVEISAAMTKLHRANINVTKFSILGYSLGGLIARLVVYRLHSQSPSFFQNIRPCNFTTFASPAIGIPILPGSLAHAVRVLSSWFLSRTGRHMYLVDTTAETGKPLVYNLSTKPYTDVLAMFDSVDVYANTILDRVVPYMTGSITGQDPFMAAAAKEQSPQSLKAAPPSYSVIHGDLEITFDEDYPNVITDIKRASPKSFSPVVTSTRESEMPRPPPSIWQNIKPWFNPTTYPNIPFPLNYVFVICLPFVLPAIAIVVGTFLAQMVASSLRTRKHLRSPQSHAKPSKNEGDVDVESQVNRRTKRTRSMDTPSVARLMEPASPISTAPSHVTTTGANFPYANIDFGGLYDPTSPANSRINDQMQLDMLANLNRDLGDVPEPATGSTSSRRIRKHLVYLPNVFTSHPVIICQNKENEVHQQGLGVVQHWADRFII